MKVQYSLNAAETPAKRMAIIQLVSALQLTFKRKDWKVKNANYLDFQCHQQQYRCYYYYPVVWY